MAPKKNISTTPSPSAVPTSAAKPTAGVTSASGQPTRAVNKPSSTTTGSSSSGQVRNAQDLQNIGLGVWNKYVDQTPQRVKLLDAFLIFLMAVGVLQFVYCVIAGNFVSTHNIFGRTGSLENNNGGSIARGFGDMMNPLTDLFVTSPSTLSSLASQQQSASSSSQSACACRPTRRTRLNLRAFLTRGTCQVFQYGERVELWTTKLTISCRAFADFIFGSMILHFFCVNFIN